MQQVALAAKVRKGTGKGHTHRIRREGGVPAVLYGKGKTIELLEVDAKSLAKLLSHGQHVLVNLQVANGNGKAEDHLAFVAEVQRDVFQKKYYHVDFKQVSMTEKVTTTVSVVFHGHAPSEKDGNIVDHARREVEIEAFISAIPQNLVLDIGGLEVGHPLHVRDLVVPEGVEILTDPNELLAVLYTPRAEAKVEEAAPAAGAAPAAEEKKSEA